jgi:hypothetical protein
LAPFILNIDICDEESIESVDLTCVDFEAFDVVVWRICPDKPEKNEESGPDD